MGLDAVWEAGQILVEDVDGDGIQEIIVSIMNGPSWADMSTGGSSQLLIFGLESVTEGQAVFDIEYEDNIWTNWSGYNISTGDLDGDGFTGNPPKNTVVAKFALLVKRKAGQTLTISESSADPDGKTGSYFYQWQRSDDGRTWNNFANANSTYTISESDQGKNIRALISYKDGLGFNEQVITAPLTIPIPISVNPPEETAGAISLAKDSNGCLLYTSPSPRD